MPRIFRLSMNIAEFMRCSSYPKDYEVFQADDGRPLPAEEAASFLVIEKARGRFLLPLSAECGNPCKHASAGCTGFDYGEQGGCPGRESDLLDHGQD
jgi:hypothetical protein